MKIIWIVALAPVVLLSGCATSATKVATSLPPLPVQVQTVKLTHMSNGITYLGSVTPYIQTTLSPAASGNLAEVGVRVGQTVVKGQLLARLSNVVNVPAVNSAQQAAVSLQNSQVVYQDTEKQYQQAKVQYHTAQKGYQDQQTQYHAAQAVFHDHLSSDSQVQSAKNVVQEQLAAITLAKITLQKAQLQANVSMGGGNTPADMTALQSVVAADEQALTFAQKQVAIAQSNMTVLTNSYQTAKQQYGAITQAEVEQAAQVYQAMLSNYQSWQNGAFAGTNPYAGSLSADQTTYQTLNQDYSALQQAKQQYNAGNLSVVQANAAQSSAQNALAQAQKNVTDANPASGTNASGLAQITVTAAQASLQQAQVQYNAAVSSLQMATQLATDRTQANQALDQAKQALNQARQSWAQATQTLNQARQSLDQAANAVKQSKVSDQSAKTTLQIQIENGQVIAPIGGLIQAVNAEVGQAVGPQTPLLTLTTEYPAMVTINVPAADIGKMAKGTAMSIYVPSLNQHLQGHVLDVHPQLSSVTNEYPVDVLIVGQQTGLLSGLQVQAQLINTSSSPVILVPADAVLSLQSGAEEVFVLRGNKVHAQIVQVGAMTSTEYQVTSGLNVGQKIVIAGQNLLSDGNQVKVVR